MKLDYSMFNLAAASVFLFSAISPAVAQVYSGCSAGPYTSCVDQVPATYLSGSWIDSNDLAEWTLIGDNASFGVAGTVGPWVPYNPVLAFPPPPLCPPVVFQITGSSYKPSSLSSSEGSTTFSWTASNPDPSGTCDGWTPVPSLTVSGTISNKGNDTASATWTSESGSGPWTMETNLLIAPTSETLALYQYYQSDGFGPTSGPNSGYQTVLFVTQNLADSTSSDPPDPNNNKFTGRQVYEVAGSGGSSDGCYTAAKALGLTYPGGPYQILGSVWNVGGLYTGEGNTYGNDQIGWQTTGVSWYRTALAGKLPCTATLSQAMDMVVNVPSVPNVQFATHTLSVTINQHSVKVTKDSLSSTETTF